MRSRPFLSASEQARPYSEIRAERREFDPGEREIETFRRRIAELEGEAQAATDPDERKRLQCEAEGLRCAIAESNRRSLWPLS